MMESFPPGTFIGEMQAPFKWILIHAARFQGIIRVNASDGEGYVMVRKGEPMGCMFQRKDDLLKGKKAYSHITSYPVVNLSILRYSGEEMESAARLVQSEGTEYHLAEPAAISGQPADHVPTQGGSGKEEINGQAGATAVKGGTVKIPARKSREGSPQTVEEKAVVLPSGLDTENLAHLLLGRMLRLPGVQAVSIFGRGSSVLSIGDVELDSLVILAEDMLEAAKEISSVMRTGQFVHLTLQIPAGKVIIAPYFNEYLCILTSPEVNLGQIRKILKEIPSASDAGGM